MASAPAHLVGCRQVGDPVGFGVELDGVAVLGCSDAKSDDEVPKSRFSILPRCRSCVSAELEPTGWGCGLIPGLVDVLWDG